MAESCVVLLGESGAGKATVANHLVGHDPLSPDEPPFKVLDVNSIYETRQREVEHETVEFMWENDLYRVTVVNAAGFFDTAIEGNDIIFDKSVQYIRENKLRIDLILFVYKMGRFTREGKQVFSFIMAKFQEKHVAGFPKDISPISALVFTRCENMSTTEREQIVQEFKVDPSTREVASQMGMGIYPVGFPPLRNMRSVLHQAYKEVILQDRDTLRELIVRVNAERERGE